MPSLHFPAITQVPWTRTHPLKGFPHLGGRDLLKQKWGHNSSPRSHGEGPDRRRWLQRDEHESHLKSGSLVLSQNQPCPWSKDSVSPTQIVRSKRPPCAHALPGAAMSTLGSCCWSWYLPRVYLTCSYCCPSFHRDGEDLPFSFPAPSSTHTLATMTC